MIIPFQVTFNGQLIENDLEPYPLLLYKNITYFPMTWRFAVTEFKWTTHWDNDKGFKIIVSDQNDYVPKDDKLTVIQIGRLADSVVSFMIMANLSVTTMCLKMQKQ